VKGQVIILAVVIILTVSLTLIILYKTGTIVPSYIEKHTVYKVYRVSPSTLTSAVIHALHSYSEITLHDQVMEYLRTGLPIIFTNSLMPNTLTIYNTTLNDVLLMKRIIDINLERYGFQKVEHFSQDISDIHKITLNFTWLNTTFITKGIYGTFGYVLKNPTNLDESTEAPISELANLTVWTKGWVEYTGDNVLVIVIYNPTDLDLKDYTVRVVIDLEREENPLTGRGTLLFEKLHHIIMSNTVKSIRLLMFNKTIYEQYLSCYTDGAPNTNNAACYHDKDDVEGKDIPKWWIPLYYWVEYWICPKAVIWVKIPYLPAKKSIVIYLLYDQSPDNPFLNPRKTFILFDNFDYEFNSVEEFEQYRLWRVNKTRGFTSNDPVVNEFYRKHVGCTSSYCPCSDNSCLYYDVTLRMSMIPNTVGNAITIINKTMLKPSEGVGYIIETRVTPVKTKFIEREILSLVELLLTAPSTSSILLINAQYNYSETEPEHPEHPLIEYNVTYSKPFGSWAGVNLQYKLVTHTIYKHLWTFTILDFSYRLEVPEPQWSTKPIIEFKHNNTYILSLGAFSDSSGCKYVFEVYEASSRHYRDLLGDAVRYGECYPFYPAFGSYAMAYLEILGISGVNVSTMYDWVIVRKFVHPEPTVSFAILKNSKILIYDLYTYKGTITSNETYTSYSVDALINAPLVGVNSTRISFSRELKVNILDYDTDSLKDGIVRITLRVSSLDNVKLWAYDGVTVRLVNMSQPITNITFNPADMTLSIETKDVDVGREVLLIEISGNKLITYTTQPLVKNLNITFLPTKNSVVTYSEDEVTLRCMYDTECYTLMKITNPDYTLTYIASPRLEVLGSEQISKVDIMPDLWIFAIPPKSTIYINMSNREIGKITREDISKMLPEIHKHNFNIREPKWWSRYVDTVNISNYTFSIGFFRVPITVKNNVNTTLTNYQVMINLTEVGINDEVSSRLINMLNSEIEDLINETCKYVNYTVIDDIYEDCVETLKNRYNEHLSDKVYNTVVFVIDNKTVPYCMQGTSNVPIYFVKVNLSRYEIKTMYMYFGFPNSTEWNEADCKIGGKVFDEVKLPISISNVGVVVECGGDEDLRRLFIGNRTDLSSSIDEECLSREECRIGIHDSIGIVKEWMWMYEPDKANRDIWFEGKDLKVKDTEKPWWLSIGITRDAISYWIYENNFSNIYCHMIYPNHNQYRTFNHICICYKDLLSDLSCLSCLSEPQECCDESIRDYCRIRKFIYPEPSASYANIEFKVNNTYIGVE